MKNNILKIKNNFASSLAMTETGSLSSPATKIQISPLTGEEPLERRFFSSAEKDSGLVPLKILYSLVKKGWQSNYMSGTISTLRNLGEESDATQVSLREDLQRLDDFFFPGDSIFRRMLLEKVQSFQLEEDEICSIKGGPTCEDENFYYIVVYFFVLHAPIIRRPGSLFAVEKPSRDVGVSDGENKPLRCVSCHLPIHLEVRDIYPLKKEGKIRLLCHVPIFSSSRMCINIEMKRTGPEFSYQMEIEDRMIRTFGVGAGLSDDKIISLVPGFTSALLIEEIIPGSEQTAILLRHDTLQPVYQWHVDEQDCVWLLGKNPFYVQVYYPDFQLCTAVNMENFPELNNYGELKHLHLYPHKHSEENFSVFFLCLNFLAGTFYYKLSLPR